MTGKTRRFRVLMQDFRLFAAKIVLGEMDSAEAWTAIPELVESCSSSSSAYLAWCFTKFTEAVREPNSAVKRADVGRAGVKSLPIKQG